MVAGDVEGVQGCKGLGDGEAVDGDDLSENVLDC